MTYVCVVVVEHYVNGRMSFLFFYKNMRVVTGH
jgi:hypothetical protein